MPVSQLLLFCEGKGGGHDVLVLNKILNGVATVSPGGSKYDLPHNFFWHRKYVPAKRVAVLRDRDFDHEAEDTVLLNQPRLWTYNEPNTENRHQIGWSWERVAIENYLLDPVVIENTMKVDPGPYREALVKAAESLGPYTAARLALSRSRVPLPRLANEWGKSKSLWPPRPADCRVQIREIVREFSKARPGADSVIDIFETVLPECQPEGARGQHPLVFFSGEDLLGAMQPAFGKMRLAQGDKLMEDVSKRISNSREDVYTWLPEWQSFRQMVEDGNPL